MKPVDNVCRAYPEIYYLQADARLFLFHGDVREVTDLPALIFIAIAGQSTKDGRDVSEFDTVLGKSVSDHFEIVNDNLWIPKFS